MRKLIAAVLAAIALAASPAAAAPTPPQPAPTISASAETLSWTSVPGSTQYQLRGRDRKAKTTAFYTTSSTTYKPLAMPGESVWFKVRSTVPRSRWSKSVEVAYGLVEELPTEEEEAPVEEPPVEEETPPPPPPGRKVAPTPLGPPTPAGGWSVAYGDAFQRPIVGTPQAAGTTGADNTWQVDNKTAGCCNNGNEPNVMRPARVSVDSEGLQESCTVLATPIAGNESRSGKQQKYECGGLGGAYCCAVNSGEPAGYFTPYFELGKGQTFAFQIVARLPVNTGEQDPGWWADGPPWNNTEVDFPEFYGAGYANDWAEAPYYFASFGEPHPDLVQWRRSFAPDQGFHTYTFYVTPGAAGKFKYAEYIDGSVVRLESENSGCYSESCAVTQSPETAAVASEKLDLILDESLREQSGSVKSGFTSGTRTLTVQTSAVYVDAPHAGVGVGDSGLAPGTAVG
jgi:hypothetical protein